MPARRRWALLVAIAAFCAVATAASAEEVVQLKNGRTLVGSIEERDDAGFWIRTETGRLRVKTDDVESVETVVARTKDTPVRAEAEGDEAKGTVAVGTKPGTAEAQAKAKAKGKDAVPEDAKARQQMVYEVMKGLASKDDVDRTRATGTIMRGWPDTAFLVDAGLSHADRRVRLGIVRVLDNKTLDDPRTYLLRAVGDKDVVVQVMAIRALRHLGAKGVETHLIRAVEPNKPWPVRQEALRTLEEIGTYRSLKAVMKGLEKDPDKRHHKAHTRVLKYVLGVDHGKDIEAWRAAVNEYRPPLPKYRTK